MAAVYCFIDDAPYEIDLFQQVYANLADEVDFVCARAFDECRAILTTRQSSPALFILDLYGRSGRAAGDIPDKCRIESLCRSFSTIDDVYDGLDAFDGNARANEYLKRLFSIADQWRELFRDAATGLDQTPRYGIRNLSLVKKHFPGTPAVIYTRKGTFPDIVDLVSLDCSGIFMKPGGASDAEILRNTKRRAPELLRAWADMAG